MARDLRRMDLSMTAPISFRRTLICCIAGILYFSSTGAALQVVSGSPCESVCSDASVGNLHDDVRCLQDEYQTAPGLALKQCVTCQMNSTAVDPATNETDVHWALFNLRYALSNCMFGYPEERVSISSPCQVTCAPLQQAVTTGIANNTETLDFTSGLDYCTGGRFDDTTINNCAFCYSLIDQQLFLGNFLQALHIACYSPPVAGHTFYPDGSAIFNTTTIAGPTGAKPPASDHAGLSGSKLILAIVLPIVVGLIILVGTCFCCWHFTRKRRQSMAASGRMSRFHDGHAAGTGYSPVAAGFAGNGRWQEGSQQVERVQVVPKVSDAFNRHSPGLAQGRYSHHDEVEVPLNNADREAFARQRQDSNLHEQYIGTAQSGVAHNPQGFHAQDGYVRDY